MKFSFCGVYDGFGVGDRLICLRNDTDREEAGATRALGIEDRLVERVALVVESS